MLNREEEWKFESYDTLPPEIAHNIDIDPDFNVYQVRVVKDHKNNHICTILFDEDNRIRNIQINLKEHQTNTNQMQRFDFPVR